MTQKLSVIVPFYNERPWLPRLWQNLLQAPFHKCEGVGSVELIFINDGSTDGSAPYLEKLLETPPVFSHCSSVEVKVIHHNTNLGKGSSVRRGINTATGDLIVILDADLEYSEQDLPVMVNPITSGIADAVIGSRFIGPRRRVFYFWNSVANKCLNFLCNILNNINITDVSTGYKAMRADIAHAFKLTSTSFGIEPELISRMAQAKIRIFEVPVSYAGRAYYDGKKFRPIHGLKMFWQTIKFGLFDKEPFKPGLWQTLSALDTVSDMIYGPLLRKALGGMAHRADKDHAKIMEIGAGTGSLTKELIHFGQVVATDISEHFVDRLQHRFGRRGDFDGFLWDATQPYRDPNQRFDYIVCFNVLEHIEQDVRALVSWRSLLQPNGKLIILVPNGRWLFTPIDTAAGHFRRYDRRDLVNKLEQAGFTCRKVFFGNALGILGWFINGKLAKKSTLPIGQLRLYAVIKRLIVPVEFLLEKFTGLSVIAVAEPAQSLKATEGEAQTLVPPYWQEAEGKA